MAAVTDIPSLLRKDFCWWNRTLSDPHQVNVIRSGVATRKIFSDASLSGWGACCGELRTHGWWSEIERTGYINFLELKAAFYALKCFAFDVRNCDILLQLDNTTAISYVNRFGSIQYPHWQKRVGAKVVISSCLRLISPSSTTLLQIASFVPLAGTE